MRTKHVNGKLCFIQEDGDPIMLVPEKMKPLLGKNLETDVHPLMYLSMLATMNLEEEDDMEMERRLS